MAIWNDPTMASVIVFLSWLLRSCLINPKNLQIGNSDWRNARDWDADCISYLMNPVIEKHGV